MSLKKLLLSASFENEFPITMETAVRPCNASLINTTRDPMVAEKVPPGIFLKVDIAPEYLWINSVDNLLGEVAPFHLCEDAA
ncbi:hypothetical protein RRF57_000209 [Xylaria bambusicola]|uniref:Uncharacterized protein n=1 Tax=Xylaria bambusicola TaxID=326684 RepID=A0AAN7U9S9_9PEZI